MKVFVKISILFLAISCNSNEETTIRYGFPNKDNIQEKYLILDEIQTYSQLTKFIEETICNNQLPILKFKSQGINKEVRSVNNCEIHKWDPNPKDILRFHYTGTIIKSDQVYPIDSLFYILKNDFDLSALASDFSSKPEKLILIIERKDNSQIQELKTLLGKITDEYDKLQSTIELKILFDLNFIGPIKPIEE